MKTLRISPRKEMPALNHDGKKLTSKLEQAEAFNSFFISESKKSVSVDSEPVPDILLPTSGERELAQITTTPAEVEQLLGALNPCKAPGFDDIPTRLLKTTARELSPSLSRLFNESFRRGEQPQDWRDATVSPLYKKAERSLVTNYRPISLLSVISKVQERIVHKRLYKHVTPFLPVDQSGFRANDSTELQLARLVHEVSESRDKGLSATACFFDLSKAFDRVWHAGLLKKLQHLGLKDTALQWMVNYLTHRRQRVRVGDAFSEWQAIPAGVPQGSVLGPLLFLIYTIDLPSACTNSNTKCSQFADDTALIATHQSRLTSELSLQSAVSAAATWLRRWHLLVNASKTVTLSFTPNHQLNITLNGTPLKQVNEHRHLGIILQNNLQWNSHVTHIINKSKKLLHQLRKTRGQLNTPSLLVIYTAYIRPVIEYGSLVLSNTTRTQKDQLERVQRRAARICLRIPLFAPVHHSSLLHHLQLPTLVSRQLLRQVTLAHNIKYIRAPLHLQQPHLARPITEQPYALRHMRTYTLRTSHTYRHTNSPINLSLHNFNQLPPDLRETNSKHAFKSMASSLILSSICSCSSSHCTPS